MQLYAVAPEHDANNAKFLEIVKRFDLQIFQPSSDAAPWHVQAIIPGPSPQLLNFWPHKLKGQRDGYRAVEGEIAITGIIQSAYEDSHDENFDVIEG